MKNFGIWIPATIWNTFYTPAVFYPSPANATDARTQQSWVRPFRQRIPFGIGRCSGDFARHFATRVVVRAATFQRWILFSVRLAERGANRFNVCRALRPSPWPRFFPDIRNRLILEIVQPTLSSWPVLHWNDADIPCEHRSSSSSSSSLVRPSRHLHIANQSVTGP